MFSIEPEFDQFQRCWQQLPRHAHPLIPRKKDITPATFGELLHQTCIGERRSVDEMYLAYAGSGFERNAGFDAMGQNYYASVPQAFLGAIKRFHDNIFSLPCAAYICDLVTSTTGNQYMHYTMHLPATDDEGVPRYLVVFGLDRKPATDVGIRAERSVAATSIKHLAYLDLGAGTPEGFVRDFQRMPGRAKMTKAHKLCPEPPGAKHQEPCEDRMKAYQFAR